MAGIVRADTFRMNTIKSQDSDVTAFTIASDGKMTTAQYIQQNGVPRFSARSGADQTGTGPAVVQFTNVEVNIGNCFSTSTYRFTAPVAGDYYLFYTMMTNGSNYLRSQLRKNGTTYIGEQVFTQNHVYSRTTSAEILTLAANDYVEVIYDVQGSDQGPVHGNYRQFCGYLVG